MSWGVRLATYDNGALSDDERAQAKRQRYMARFDAYPPAVRAALREHTFDLWIMLQPRGLNWGLILERIAAVTTRSEAAEFNQQFGRG